MELRRPTPDGAPDAGEEAPFELLYRAHREQVLRWSLRYMGGDVTAAEDLAHDVFIQVLERMSGLERPEELNGWLYRVTAHLAISRWRRERSRWARVRSALAHEAAEPSPSPADALELREGARRALAQLRALPPRERVVLCMKLLDGRSQRDIAGCLGLSDGDVAKLVTRALARVRAAGWTIDAGE